jgi:hypothetical protein
MITFNNELNRKELFEALQLAMPAGFNQMCSD